MRYSDLREVFTDLKWEVVCPSVTLIDCDHIKIVGK